MLAPQPFSQPAWHYRGAGGPVSEKEGVGGGAEGEGGSTTSAPMIKSQGRLAGELKTSLCENRGLLLHPLGGFTARQLAFT